MPTTGTLDIGILPGAKMRIGSTEEIVVTFSLDDGSDALPPYAAVTLICDNQTAVVSGLQTRPLKGFGKELDKRYRAEFYINISPALTENQPILLKATISGATAAPASKQPTASPAAVITDKAQDPAPIYFTTTAQDLPPQTATQKVRYALTVCEEDGTTPIEGYIVEWRQAWDTGLFDSTRAYASLDSVTPLVPDFSTGNSDGLVRTKTDSLGKAEIYIVPGKTPKYFGIRCLAIQGSAITYEPIILYDPKQSIFWLDEPTPQLGKDTLGNYNLDSTNDDAVNCPITYSLYMQPMGEVRILFFAGDDKLVKIINTDLSNNPRPQIDILVEKTFFKIGLGPENINNFYYVIGIREAGSIKSVSSKFYTSGDPGENKPDPSIKPRDLSKPIVRDTGPYINGTTLEDGFLHVTIPFDKSTVEWPAPAVGDTITARIYLNGQDPLTHNAKSNSFSNSPQPISQDDIKAGYAEIKFPRIDLNGYDAPDGKYGTYYAEYYVQISGVGNKIYSAIDSRFLDTVAPGKYPPEPSYS